MKKRSETEPTDPNEPVDEGRPEAHAAEILPHLTETLFPIAGIGGGAGALPPFLEIVRELGESPGLAIVLILHADAHGGDLAAEVAKETSMPVTPVVDGDEAQRDRIYISPSGTKVTIADRRFIVRPLQEPAVPIDAFLCSLAEDMGERSLGVILSGSGNDGVRGIRAVKAEGGLALAQDESAEFPQMPHAAVLAGGADSVYAPRKIARELRRVVSNTAALRRLPERELHTVFGLLQRSHGIDFTHYKPATIERRIRRRMAVHRVGDLRQYVALLREQPSELQQLHNEILIRVTSFFRDPEVFDTLRKQIFPKILEGRSNDDPVRIWVPGCATGEEVYSLAMLLVETSAELGFNCPFQIFGTDVSEVALERARQAFFAEAIAEEVSPERLRRFFTRTDGGYRVAKSIRDCCIFARQNVAKDPPFSRLDLISCRNVMIYLGSVLQRKVMNIFHYGLRPDGYLLLGSSETIGNFGELFATADRKHKIYQKKPAVSRLSVDFSATMPHREPVERTPMVEELPPTPGNVFREADRVMLSRYSPPGVLINESLEILQFRGRTSPFLEPPAGAASFNVLKMAREGLLTDLRAAIEDARRTDTPVRREGVRVRTNGHIAEVNLEVIPFHTPGKERFQLILFDEVPVQPDKPSRGAGRKKKASAEDPDQVDRLKRELEGTREYLQSIIEEQEAMNEELRSANEEIQSSNEELQSTNEELETAKEELQSSNEELTTLNEELENRNVELAQANDDLLNILASIDVPIVMLDGQLRVRRFNPGAQRVLDLLPSDIGRPLWDLRTPLKLSAFGATVAEVIDNLDVRELEVQHRDGATFLLRIRPYKTSDNRIEGAVLVLIDMDQLRRTKG